MSLFLQNSELFYHQALDAVQLPIVIVDHTGSIVAGNVLWKHFSDDPTHKGFLAENYLAVFQQLQPLEASDIKTCQQGLEDTLAGKQAIFEFRYRRLLGKNEHWFQMQMSPLSTPLHGVVISHLDITKEWQAKAQMTMLLESPIDALMIVDTDGLIQMINSQMEQMFGYSRDDLIGQHLEVLLPHRFRHQHQKHMAGYMAKPRMRSMGTGLELYGLRKDGTEFPIEISLNPLQTTGTPLVSAAIRDVSERKASQQALQDSQQRVAMHVANTPLAVLEWRIEDGIITAWNPAAERLFGYRADEVIGKHRADFIVPEDQRTKLKMLLQSNIHTRGFRSTSKNITKEGRLITCEWYNTVLDDVAKEGKRMAALALDITARQRAINDLLSVQEEERSRISKDLHDHVGQLLTGLNLGLSAVVEKPDKQKLMDLKALASTILEDVRRISRDLRPALLDELGLATAIKRFARELLPEGSPTKVDILVRVPETLERNTTTVIYRVIQEALTNVVRHANAKNASVVVTTSEDALQLIVEDDGVGFDPNAVATSEHVGLSSMRERVELLGGIFAVESLPNQGTTISARLALT